MEPLYEGVSRNRARWQEMASRDQTPEPAPRGLTAHCSLIASSLGTLYKYEAPHEKTDLKIFVIVIPKERLAGKAPPILLLVWHRLLIYNLQPSQIIFYSRCSQIIFYSPCHTKRRIGLTTTKVCFRSVFSWRASCFPKQSTLLYWNVIPSIWGYSRVDCTCSQICCFLSSLNLQIFTGFLPNQVELRHTKTGP